MTPIETCRTAALGGHVELCDRCGHVRVRTTAALWRAPEGLELLDVTTVSDALMDW
jgi:hypothetical protein